MENLNNMTSHFRLNRTVGWKGHDLCESEKAKCVHSFSLIRSQSSLDL